MLLNYHIGRFVLSSLCVGGLVWLVLDGVRFAGFSLGCCEHGNEPSHSIRCGQFNPYLANVENMASF